MSYTKDLEEIQSIKDKKPTKCVFCIDRTKVFEHGLWNFSAPADLIIKELVFKATGLTKCDHSKANEATLQYSEFLASIMCNYIMKYHLDRQQDGLYIESCLRNRMLMKRLMREYVQENLNFDQSKHNPEGREYLKRKYQRHAEYEKHLRGLIYD